MYRKKIILLLILLSGVKISYSQDTINHYLVSGCLANYLKTLIIPNSPPININFNFLNDSLNITGEIGANCGSAHIAIINKIKDTIFITTMDTGKMTTCGCIFNFKIKTKSLVSDTIIKFNGKTYNTKGLYSSLKKLDDDNALISIYPSPTSDFIKISSQSSIQIDRIYILDYLGRPVKTTVNSDFEIDMTGLQSGLYFIDFKINGQKHLLKKIIKK